MGRRILEITPELLVSILQGLASGPPRYFEVIRDALPDDVQIVSAANIPLPSNPYCSTIKMTLESPAWPDLDTQDGTPHVLPLLRVVQREVAADG